MKHKNHMFRKAVSKLGDKKIEHRIIIQKRWSVVREYDMTMDEFFKKLNKFMVSKVFVTVVDKRNWFKRLFNIDSKNCLVYASIKEDKFMDFLYEERNKNV